VAGDEAVVARVLQATLRGSGCPRGAGKDGVLYDRKAGLNYETIRVADYVDVLEAGTPIDLYVVFRVHEVRPELLDDIIRPPYCRDAEWVRSRFWFAGPDTKGALHRDLPHNLFAHVLATSSSCCSTGG
jgi:hypothetical protein